jgi:hypothetical protein
MSFPNWLHQCRDAIGEPPRAFGWWDRLTYFSIKRPDWLDDDQFVLFFRGYKQLLRDAPVVWGHIVQANSLLFEKSNIDSAAAVLYSLNPTVNVSPELLGATAHRIFSLKGTTPTDPDLAPLAAHLTDEKSRAFGMPVPGKLCPVPCAVTSTFLPRHYLPGQCLRKPLMPVLVSQERPHIATVLPGRYWPAELLEWWFCTDDE